MNTGPSLIDRRVRKIANARSVTLGLATTFLGLALVGAVVMRIVDSHDFPTIGLALWWTLQTVTTVGYGDIVPTTHVGRIIGGVELVISVSFIAFLTAGVTSTVIQRGQTQAQESEGAQARARRANDRRRTRRDETSDHRSGQATRKHRVARGTLT